MVEGWNGRMLVKWYAGGVVNVWIGEMFGCWDVGVLGCSGVRMDGVVSARCSRDGGCDEMVDIRVLGTCHYGFESLQP